VNPLVTHPDNFGNRSYRGTSFIGFLDGAVPVLASGNVVLQFLGKLPLFFKPLSRPMPCGSGLFSPPRRIAWEDVADEAIESANRGAP